MKQSLHITGEVLQVKEPTEAWHKWSQLIFASTPFGHTQIEVRGNDKVKLRPGDRIDCGVRFDQNTYTGKGDRYYAHIILDHLN